MKTRVFDLATEYGYTSLRSLARAMGRDVAELSRIRSGKHGITRSFIEGALRAFPDKTLDELFYVDEPASVA